MAIIQMLRVPKREIAEGKDEGLLGVLTHFYEVSLKRISYSRVFSHHTILDACVQIDDDVNSSDEDLSGNENDDYSNTSVMVFPCCVQLKKFCIER